MFPLDEKAAVCGFEAFINDKHVVGTVKTKEIAQKEYQEAVREGHGAYLMQEEASVCIYSNQLPAMLNRRKKPATEPPPHEEFNIKKIFCPTSPLTVGIFSHV